MIKKNEKTIFLEELWLILAFSNSSLHVITNLSKIYFIEVQFFKYSSVLRFIKHLQVHTLGFHI